MIVLQLEAYHCMKCYAQFIVDIERKTLDIDDIDNDKIIYKHPSKEMSGKFCEDEAVEFEMPLKSCLKSIQ